jgi:hypothetical protein
VGQYSTYLTQTRQLLHDPQGNAWSDTTLASFINEARRRVAKDTYCLRDLYTSLTLTAGTERYTINTFVPPAIQGLVAAVIGIDLYYGNSRYPLTYMAWREFSLKLRYWQNLQQLPVAWSRLGNASFYVGPIPDQGYTVDLDLAVVPQPLTSDAQSEVIPINYTDAVPWWAARLAKTNEQALGEAQFFEKEYFAQLGIETAAFQRFSYAPR